MNTELTAWLLAAGERGAEIWCDSGGRIHYRVPDALVADGLVTALREKAPELNQFYKPIPGVVGPFRLAPSQSAIYFQSRVAPDSFGHVLRYPMRVRADIDAAALTRALRALAIRHPMLCTRFRMDRVQPMLFFSVEPALPLSIDGIDVSAPDAVQRWIEQHSTAPMDLDHGPLCRFHLARAGHVDGAAFLLLLVAHHCIVDFVSLEIVWRDLDRLYREEFSGQAAPLPPLPFGLSDLTNLPHWQAARPAAKQQRDAWRAKLTVLPPPLTLASEREDARSTGSGFEFFRRLDPALREGVRRLAQDLRTTEFVVMFTVHALQLLRRTHASAICLGVATAGRSGHPGQDLVGCFVNTVPVIVEYALLSIPPMEAVRRLERPLRDAVAADLLPFIELVKLATVERSPGRPLLFRTLFTWLDGSRRERDALDGVQGLGATTYEPVGMSRIGVTHDLVLAVHNRCANTYVNWAFDAGIHKADTVVEMAEEYERMLRSLAAPETVSHAAQGAARERFEL